MMIIRSNNNSNVNIVFGFRINSSKLLLLEKFGQSPKKELPDNDDVDTGSLGDGSDAGDDILTGGCFDVFVWGWGDGSGIGAGAGLADL